MMADTNETIADIIAEKRQYADDIERACNEIVAEDPSMVEKANDYKGTAIAGIRQEADRLEAAWKRDTKELRVEIERLKEERNYSGVRERERLRAKGFAIVPKEQLDRGDCAKLREALATIRKRLVVTYESEASFMRYSPNKPLVDLIDAALSAPPRNCDLPKVVEDPWRAWLDDESNWEDGNPKLEIHEWLLAPATEKEGGDK